MGFSLSTRSKNNLKDVHPDLVRVVMRALQEGPQDFVVIEGLRSLERQQKLYAVGASRTINSRHLTGHAVDLACILDGEVSWRPALYPMLAQQMLKAAALEKVPLEWGGNCFGKFYDGDHFQLPRKDYP